ncbi:hypothetical protein HY464_02225 [Candidatus Peregrinibacteria bacterium]|nr:hypothetical protein [Candidatus Peregrinibacteria bacterium]
MHMVCTEMALQAAVEKGVRCKNGVYRFFDPGASLVTLRDFPVIRQQKLVYRRAWFEPYDWATCQDTPQERTLRIPVEGSFGEKFLAQQKLLTPEEEVSSTRIVTMFLVINALATGERLLLDRWVRCIDKDSDGCRVRVGGCDADGLDILNCWDDEHGQDLGVSATLVVAGLEAPKPRRDTDIVCKPTPRRRRCGYHDDGGTFIMRGSGDVG